MFGALTAYLSVRVRKSVAIPTLPEPALRPGSEPASGLTLGQSQMIRQFIAMAQAARRTRET